METIYYVYNAYKGTTLTIGNKEDLIKYLAGSWELCQTGNDMTRWRKTSYNHLIHYSYCEEQSYQKHGKIYQFFDNYGRIVNPKDYVEISFNYYLHGKTLYIFERKINRRSKYFGYFRYLNNYKYRYDPVPYIYKIRRGGPFQRNPKTKHIFMVYDEPFYGRKYARGTDRGVPSWWDDKIKKRDIKNWKHQSKCRHQWQRGEKDHWLGQ